MSTSRRPTARRRRAAPPPATVHAVPAQDNGGTAFTLPVTVSRAVLLDNGSDERFRRMVYDLLTIADCMEAVREHLARQVGITVPQYSVLMAIAQFQGESGVSVGALAKVLHVSSAFIASETGKLARQGLVVKCENPRDRRGVLLSLTRSARRQIARLTPEIRAVNDLFFGPLSRAAFARLAGASALLVRSSQKVMQRLRPVASEATRLPVAAE
jgi:DNA-binding MarR family transcriptional regulator